MRTMTDYESVNLSTGKRTRYVVGEGERISEENYRLLQILKEAYKKVLPIIRREAEAEFIPADVLGFRLD